MNLSFKNITFLGIFLVIPFGIIFAQENISSSDIEKQIQAKETQIRELELKIREYQLQAENYSGQAKSLNQEVSQLLSSERILETSLSTTKNKIEKTNYTLTKNVSEIQDLSENISINRQAIAESIRSLHMSDNENSIMFFLKKNTLSDFLRNYQNITSLHNHLRGTIDIMRDRNIELVRAQQQLVENKSELQKLSSEFADKEKIVSGQRIEKNQILKETKNKEAEYQRIVSELKQRQAQLDAEIRDFESKLKFSLNPQSLPNAGSGVLAWPLDNVVITQPFGRTVDAKRLYVSGSHSGVDFRAAVGTPVYSVADGVIEGVGDTDKTCTKASFGKWIFIEHNNGLSTAYGHLSLIKVVKGQVIKKGELIGYSGNTGRSTGPHLHLTVYASNGINGEDGARVTERPSTACSGKTYTMPLAPINAYLDPMLYLPKTGFTSKQ